MICYAATFYIRREYPELSANECIDLSIKMMKGHKADFFVLALSKAGVSIVGGVFSIITCGLGLVAFFWIIPFFYLLTAEFYEDVKADYEYKQHFNL